MFKKANKKDGENRKKAKCKDDLFKLGVEKILMDLNDLMLEKS